MRHGKSAWDSHAPSDRSRPLTPRGHRDAADAGMWIVRKGLVPEAVVSSPATRAGQTALAAGAAWGLSADEIEWDPDLYGGGPDALRAAIARHADAKALLLVGHNPGMDEMANLLAADALQPTPAGRVMTTAALAVIDLGDDAVDAGLPAACANKVEVVRRDGFR